MNKSELLAALNEKYHKISLREMPVTTYGTNLKYYFCIVFDKDGDIIRQREIHFYVENEGEANEVAYWDRVEPKLPPIESPSQKLLNYIASKIVDGTIRAGYIEESDNISETAIVKVVMEIGGNTVEKRIFIDKDPQGNLRQEVLP